MAINVQQADVEAALLRPLTDSEATYLPVLLVQAAALLKARIPDLDSRMDAFYAGSPPPLGVDPETAVAVIASVIARFLTNPDGASSTSQTLGPYSASRNYFGNNATEGRGQIRITDADVAAIIPASNYSSSATIRTTPRRWL